MTAEPEDIWHALLDEKVYDQLCPFYLWHDEDSPDHPNCSWSVLAVQYTTRQDEDLAKDLLRDPPWSRDHLQRHRPFRQSGEQHRRFVRQRIPTALLRGVASEPRTVRRSL